MRERQFCFQCLCYFFSSGLYVFVFALHLLGMIFGVILHFPCSCCSLSFSKAFFNLKNKMLHINKDFGTQKPNKLCAFFGFWCAWFVFPEITQIAICNTSVRMYCCLHSIDNLQLGCMLLHQFPFFVLSLPKSTYFSRYMYSTEWSSSKVLKVEKLFWSYTRQCIPSPPL